MDSKQSRSVVLGFEVFHGMLNCRCGPRLGQSAERGFDRFALRTTAPQLCKRGQFQNLLSPYPVNANWGMRLRW